VKVEEIVKVFRFVIIFSVAEKTFDMKLLVFLAVLLLAVARSSVESPPSFRPEFIAIHSREPLPIAPVKWPKPIYNLVGWKRADGTVDRDIFKAGEVTPTYPPSVEQ
jgi:hypothetical protein